MTRWPLFAALVSNWLPARTRPPPSGLLLWAPREPLELAGRLVLGTHRACSTGDDLAARSVLIITQHPDGCERGTGNGLNFLDVV